MKEITLIGCLAKLISTQEEKRKNGRAHEPVNCNVLYFSNLSQFLDGMYFLSDIFLIRSGYISKRVVKKHFFNITVCISAVSLMVSFLTDVITNTNLLLLLLQCF